MSLARKLPLVLLLVLVAAVVLGVMMIWPHLEGQGPELTIKPTPSYLGRVTGLELSLRDQGSGLDSLRVIALQNGKEIKILEKNYVTGSMWERGGQAETSEKLEIKAQELGLVQGSAALIFQVRDRSFRGWFHGNLTEQQYQVTVDLTPPRISVLSRTIHLNRGGVGLAVYKLNKPLSLHGVQVGNHFFRGYTPWPQDPLACLAYFAFPDDEDKNAGIRVIAQDGGGNQAAAGLTVRLKWKEFRSDTLNISDNFLEAIAPRFQAEAPADKQQPLEAFLWANDGLRKLNHEKIQAATAQSDTYQLWRGPFVRPMGKPMAGYADRRTYVYKGREVSHATHLGVDLADLAMSPIKSTAAGRVVFAGPLGIYGNCVILDHGQGISSLYGHMAQIDVHPGDMVPLEGVLGRSGATGLALGDHLHISILVDGIFVTPTEWWDPHWIQDNVTLRFTEAGLPSPTAPK